MVRSKTPVGTEIPELDASPSEKAADLRPDHTRTEQQINCHYGECRWITHAQATHQEIVYQAACRPFPNVDIDTLVNAMKRAFPRTDVAFVAKEIAFVVENRNLATPTPVSSRRILKELRKRRRVLFRMTPRRLEFDRAEKAVRRLPGNSSYILEARRRR